MYLYNDADICPSIHEKMNSQGKMNAFQKIITAIKMLPEQLISR